MISNRAPGACAWRWFFADEANYSP